jgi:hypothetical protein
MNVVYVSIKTRLLAVEANNAPKEPDSFLPLASETKMRDVMHHLKHMHC